MRPLPLHCAYVVTRHIEWSIVPGTKEGICHRHTAVGECWALQALLWPMVREVLCHRGVIPARWSDMDKLRSAWHDDRGGACGSILLWGVGPRCPMASVDRALETAALSSPLNRRHT